jgi:hypothetical protein
VDIKEEFEVTLNLEQINYIINTLIVDTIISPTFNNDNARIIFDICENLAKAQGRTYPTGTSRGVNGLRV